MDSTAIAGRWERWATNSLLQAWLLRQTGRSFEANLHTVRAHTRRAAARLLRDMRDPIAAATVMHHNALALSQRDSPLIGYDHAAFDYTRARTWQACAWELDHSLSEVQPRWD